MKLDKPNGADFEYEKIFLKFQLKNTRIRHFWFDIWAFLFFRKILRLEKFEGADIKYFKTVFKFQREGT